MATKIEMAANALILLGDNPIESFDDNSAGAEAMANLYETTYLDLLTQAPWGFARKQQLLSQNATPPTFDNYAYSYNLPSDAISIYGLRSNLEYHLYEGGLLYTNDSKAELDFFIRPNEGDLPPYFVKLMEETLAARAAMAVTQDLQTYQLKAQDAAAQLLIAMGIDAQNETNEAVRSSPFIEVRG
jgi:hypothetical protein